jgi:rhodanese-related sulfurtransferase
MSEFPDVPVTELPDDAVVLDIREQEEWDRGHAPTAVHIPMSELPARVDELAPFLDRDEPLVITCRSGGRVLRVMPWLAQQGYEVANMNGGMRAWLAAGKPMEAGGGAEPHVP